MEITEVKVFPVRDKKLRAFASIVFDGVFMVNDIKIIQGRDGFFISMPSRRKKNGRFKDIAHPLNQETRQRLEERIISEYRRVAESAPEKQPGQGERPAEEPDRGEPSRRSEGNVAPAAGGGTAPPEQGRQQPARDGGAGRPGAAGPEPTQPAAEPAPAEPAPAEPASAEAAPAEAAPAEPAPAEPARAEPARGEAAGADAPPQEPAHGDPPRPGTSHRETRHREKAAADPARAGRASAEAGEDGGAERKERDGERAEGEEKSLDEVAEAHLSDSYWTS